MPELFLARKNRAPAHIVSPTKTHNMARKKKQSTETAAAQAAPAVEAIPAVTPKLIVAQRKYDRWYVYFQGVHPRDNVGCGCKTARSALRYMFLLRDRHGATISQNVFDRLSFEAAREARQ